MTGAIQKLVKYDILSHIGRNRWLDEILLGGTDDKKCIHIHT